MEQNELNNPMETCYREIFEEAGISRNDIHNLALFYIIVRRSGDEIRQSYIYFGVTSCSDVLLTDESTLFWIPESELLCRDYTKTFAAMLAHYIERNPHDRTIYVGVADNDNGKLLLHWSQCVDFE